MKRLIWGGFAILAGLTIACSAPTSGGSGNGGGKKPAPVVAPAGSAVRDGKFEFQVTKVDCGKLSVGKGALSKRAQGEFCIITLTIANIGKEASSFDDGNQAAYDASNNKYDTDGTAGLYANSNDEAFLNNINPGNKVTANIVFDVPKSTKLTVLEFHDSAFSGGVKVAIG